MIDYLSLKIERERSEYPTGLKHFKKDTVAENSLFDIDLMMYKALGITKGQDNGREKDISRCETQGESTTEEVCRGVCERGIHEDRHTEGYNGESEGRTGRDCALDKGEREADKESDSESKAEIETQTHED